MLHRAPVSLHLDLFRYWGAKRKGRPMPARRDIDPTEMPAAVLRQVAIIDQVDGRFRYRLIGTGVVRDLGRDFTGRWVGSYGDSPAYAAAVIAIYERVFDSASPVFTTGEHRTRKGVIESNSRLVLPLSEDGLNVNMAILTRVARFNRKLGAGTDWLKDAPGKLCSVIDVATTEQLEKHCLEWIGRCRSNTPSSTHPEAHSVRA
ncbi:MAG TPA: PAS domain-containing protein [Stellaceae bacterium]|nr:PAS domain-containing protein [Stellaceae bacterium]